MALTKVTIVLQTPTFKKAVKKLNANQKKELDNAIKALMKESTLGERKKAI
jgi:mRNA interferase YafQ